MITSNNRYAIIDLGSNTFHILIAEYAKTITEIYRKRVFVGLSEGGISKIKNSKIKLGLETLMDFKKEITVHHCDKVKIIGTSALRSASNSKSFVVPAEQIMGQSIEIIDGSREAELIFKGVSQIAPMKTDSLIMDIGGGSTEFIIVKDQQMVWRRSYKLGVGVLFALFHKSDPLSGKDLNDLKTHINSTLSELKEKILSFRISNLIGASGSFEVLDSMMGKSIERHKVTIIKLSDFALIYDKLIGSSLIQREQMKGLPKERAKLIVVAFVLMNEIIKMARPSSITISPYALKEGILSEM